MFDDVNSSQQPNKSGDGQPLEDMFNDTDPIANAESAQSAPPQPGTAADIGNSSMPNNAMSGADVPTVGPTPYTSSTSMGKKILIVVVVLIVAAGLGVLGWWYYSQVLKTRATDTQLPVPNANTDSTNTNTVTEPVIEPEPTPAPAPVVTPEPEIEPEPVDRDGDGLTDAEEAEAGTNPLQADTDNDGLFDREEIAVYNTDPLNEDTDGDTYLDGAEVQNGYNPNGPGELDLTIPSQQ